MQKTDTEEQIKVRQPLSKLEYPGEKLSEDYEKIIAEEVNVKIVQKGEKVLLDKTLTEELKKEGFARELIRVVQSARKKAGLNVDDRIKLSISISLDEEWEELVKTETLALQISQNENYGYCEDAKVEGQNIKISLEKA